MKVLADVPAVARVFPLIAGLVTGLVNVVLSTSFLAGLIDSLVSGLLVGGGTVVAAVVAARVTGRKVESLHQDVQVIKRGAGLAKRVSDQEIVDGE